MQTLACGQRTAKDLAFLLMSSTLISESAWCEKCQMLHVVEESFQVPLPFQSNYTQLLIALYTVNDNMHTLLQCAYYV